MKHDDYGEFGGRQTHLAVMADVVAAAESTIIEEWLPEAVRALREGGWTQEDFTVAELEHEASLLISRLAERLRHGTRAEQTPEERRGFRLLAGPEILGSDRDVALVSLLRVYVLFTHFLNAAVAAGLREEWPASVAVDVLREVGEAVRIASGFPTTCEFVRAVEDRLRERQAVTAAVFRQMLTAQEDERKRLSRDIHDVLAQTLAACHYRAETCALIMDSDPEAARRDLEMVAGLIAQTLEQVREIIFDLRPTTLDRGTLAAAVEAYIDRMQGHAPRVSFDVSEEGDTSALDETLRTALYRIIQEAVSNILRHSGADRAEVQIVARPDEVSVVVDDAGAGFDVERIEATNEEAHVGIASMRERAQLLGGSFELRSEPGTGTRVDVRVPVH